MSLPEICNPASSLCKLPHSCTLLHVFPNHICHCYPQEYMPCPWEPGTLPSPEGSYPIAPSPNFSSSSKTLLTFGVFPETSMLCTLIPLESCSYIFQSTCFFQSTLKPVCTSVFMSLKSNQWQGPWLVFNKK